MIFCFTRVPIFSIVSFSVRKNSGKCLENYKTIMANIVNIFILWYNVFLSVLGPGNVLEVKKYILIVFQNYVDGTICLYEWRIWISYNY